MKVKNLVLDTNYFVNRRESVPADRYYTTQEVIDEVKDEASRAFLGQFYLANELKVLQPSYQDFAFVSKAADRLNQLVYLSRQDLGVIALAVYLATQLGLKCNEVEKIDYSYFELEDKEHAVEFEEVTESEDEQEQKALQEKYGQQLTEEELENVRIAQQAAQDLKNEDGWVECKRVKKIEKKQFFKQERLDFGGGEWITRDNVEKHLHDTGATVTAERVDEIELGIYTEDRGMQNLILALGLKLVNSGCFVIEKVKHFALKCAACRRVFFDSEAVFTYHRNQGLASDDTCNAMKFHCPHCANVGLMRVAVYVQNGKVTTTKGIKHFDLRGTVYNLADLTKNKYAGYKKSYLLHPELYEEHRLKLAYYGGAKPKAIEFGDDMMKGVGREEDGTDVAYFLRRNPNAQGKKLISK